MRRRTLSLMLSLLLVQCACSGRVAAQLEPVLLKIPASANAMAIFNTKALHDRLSTVADDLAAAGLRIPLDSVSWYLQAGELDYEYMHLVWEVSLAAVAQAPPMEQVAAANGGRLDQLAGSRTVERANDSYVVAFGPKILAAMSPANRQTVVRWIREAKTRKAVAISPYLAKAAAVAQEGPAQIVLAFDLQGVLAPEEVSQALAKSPSLTTAGVDPNQAASVISGLIGMRMDIEFTDSAHGMLLIEFQQPPTILAQVAKPLLLEILQRRGAHAGALPNWTVDARGNTIVLEGPMSPSGLRRVASILTSSTGPWSSPGPTSQAVSPESVTGQASQEYFQAVTGYLDDLFGGNIQPQNLYQMQVWVDRYARQIQSLNTTNVDPAVLSYASNVVMLLGEIGNAVQRAQSRQDIRESMMDGPGSYRYNRYGAYGWIEKPYVERDRALVQVDEASQALGVAQQVIADLHAISSQTRQEMTQRYGIQF